MILNELFEQKGELKNLYCSRKVLNGKDIVAWAKTQGFADILSPEDMHVTIAHSKAKLDWDAIPDSFDHITIAQGRGERVVKDFGTAIVLHFKDQALTNRAEELKKLGASSDFPTYKAHISIVYGKLPEGLELKDIEPYEGVIKLGPEIFKEIDNDYKKKLDEKNKLKETQERLPDNVIKAFEELGNQQRGRPERAMLRVQNANIGGVLNSLVEHTGDLVHRMSHLASKGVFDYDIGNKVNRMLRLLQSGYGFEREHMENMRSNADYNNETIEERKSKIDATLHQYYVEHSKLPAYNRAQWLANEASMAIGLQKWEVAEKYLVELKSMVVSPEGFNHYASQYKLDSDGNLLTYPYALDEAFVPTPAFNAWFKNSKVVDATGKPLVVYHGTNQPIEAFSKNRGGMSTGETGGATLGFFFTSDPEEAADYAGNAGRRVVHNVDAFEKERDRLEAETYRLEKQGQRTGNWKPYEEAMSAWESLEIDATREDELVGQNLVPVYLSIQNPAYYDFKGGGNGPSTGVNFEEMIAAAKQKGHDGFIARNIKDSPTGHFVSDHYVVFSPNQIKSAFSTNFDPNSYDIIAEEAFKLPNGNGSRTTSIFKNPTKSQLRALVENARMHLIRGMMLEINGKWALYVWAAYSLGHWNFIADMHDGGERFENYISVYLSDDLETLERNKDWRDVPVQQANGFFYALSSKPNIRPREKEIASQFSVFKDTQLNEINLIGDFDDDLNAFRRENGTSNWSMPKKAKKVGEIADLKLYKSSDYATDTYYLLSDKKRPLGKANLIRSNVIKERNFYKVSHIWFDPTIRGKGYGFKFYEYLLNTGINIVSDSDQTRFAKELWQKLARKYTVRPYDGEDIGEPITDTSEFYGNNFDLLIASKDDVLKESFSAQDVDPDQLYNTFKKSYEDSTGTSWSRDKLFSRARDWKFFGDETGFVAIRQQRSGMKKLVAVAGNPRSILKGLDELAKEGGPIWGAVSEEMIPMAKRRGFIAPHQIPGGTFFIKMLMKAIPSYVFGGVEPVVGNDGSITLDYADVGSAKKYIIGNKEYFAFMTKIPDVSEYLQKVPGLDAFLKMIGLGNRG